MPDRPAGADPGGTYADMVVTVGTHIEVELVSATGESERLSLDIVRAGQADFGAGFLGAGTPLAQALIGQRAGDRVPYGVADMVSVRILSVGPSRRAPDAGAAAERENIIREAIERSEREDTIRLALAVDVKWGDYDPEALAPDDTLQADETAGPEDDE